MRVDSEQLPKHLERGLKPLYTIYGDAPLLAIEAADLIRARARREGYQEREVLFVEPGFNWERLTAASCNLSLFGVKRLLDIRMPTGKPGVDGALALQDYCGRLPSDTVTLISLPRLERQSLAAKWFEALEKTGVVIAANAIERSRLPQWITGRLAAQDQQADPEALEFLADRVEGNLLAAHQEVQKLGLLFPAGKLTFMQVKDSVLDVARYDVFQLGEAMLTGDAARFARILDGLKGEGVALPLILWAIAEEIRALSKIVRGLAEGKGLAQLMREARVWGERQNLAQQASKRLSRAMLEDTLAATAEIDKTIKGLRAGDAWNELLNLGLRFALARPKQAKTA